MTCFGDITMANSAENLPDGVFHCLIMTYDKESENSKQLMEMLRTVGCMVDFIDETEYGQLELTSVNQAINNTPVVLVLVSEELTKDERMKEIYCMVLQKRFDENTPNQTRIIPIYSPSKKVISYYKDLPKYITNKVSMDFNPINPKHLLKCFQDKVLASRWYKTALQSIIQNCSKGDVSSPSDLTTNQNTASCGTTIPRAHEESSDVEITEERASGLVQKECLSSHSNKECSMIANCDSAKHSSDLSDARGASLEKSSDEYVISSNVLNSFTRLQIQNSDKWLPQSGPVSHALLRCTPDNAAETTKPFEKLPALQNVPETTNTSLRNDGYVLPETIPKHYHSSDGNTEHMLGSCSTQRACSNTGNTQVKQVAIGNRNTEVGNNQLYVPKSGTQTEQTSPSPSTADVLFGRSREAIETECSFAETSSNISSSQENTSEQPFYLAKGTKI